MKKVKVILTKLNADNYPFSVITGQLSTNQRRRFKQRVAREVREIKYHFKKYGWDLDWGVIKDSVLNPVFGNGLSGYLLSAVMNATDAMLCMKDNTLILSKSKRSKKRSQL